MTIIDIALCGVLAVSSAGFPLLRQPAPVPVVELAVPQGENSQTLGKKGSPADSEKEKAPVQPIEERGDAMLFEADALASMPFNLAVVMPFD
ncbi:hypothetical protein P4B35_20500 [Pontiellaceae bacterium B12227]|nr:hypothetical protein [Pontiellaceae bacterium B12227]